MTAKKMSACLTRCLRGWVWSCVRPYVCATGADESATLEAGVAAIGHEDVYVYDSEVAS